MLTVEEVASRLKVTARTVYRWIDEGKLKALKIQGVVRITEEAYSEFINKAG
ncbi:MAG: helix-turn-helix domain-containing protein [Eubacteriales bacterium]|jgi:excisionase family DNA binding protein